MTRFKTMQNSSIKYAKMLLFFSIVIALLTITAKQSIMAEIENNKIIEQKQKEKQEAIEHFIEKNNDLLEQPQQITISKEQIAADEMAKGNIDNAIAIYQELLNDPDTNQDEIKNKLIECYRQKGLEEEIEKLLENSNENPIQNNTSSENEIISNQNAQE